MNFPSALAFDANGNLYVANAGNYTIEKFSPGGTGSVFATASSGIDNPEGLAFYDGYLYVANYGDNTIEKFNSLGQGSVFTSTNLLFFPYGLAFDSNGNLYVANEGNGEVLEFGPNGVGTVVASGLGNAIYLAIEEIPEPSGILLVSLALPLLFLPRVAASFSRGARYRRRHSQHPEAGRGVNALQFTTVPNCGSKSAWPDRCEWSFPVPSIT